MIQPSSGVCLLMLMLVLGCGQQGEPERLLLGHLTPGRTADRSVGASTRRGISLAVERGGEKEWAVADRRLAFLHVDGRGKPTLVQAETVRLLRINGVVGLVGGFDPQAIHALVRTADRYDTPVVVPGECVERLGAEKMLTAPAHRRGKMLAQYAHGSLKVRSAVVLVADKDSISRSLASSFTQTWRQLPMTQMRRWSYQDANERDDAIKSMGKTQARVVLIAAPLREFGQILSQLGEAGLKVPVLYGGPDVGPGPLSQLGIGSSSDSARLYLATSYTPEGLTDAGKEFLQKYRERFSTEPDFFAAQSHDAALLLLETLQRTQSLELAKIRKDLMEREQFESLTGPVAWKAGQPVRRVFVVQVTRGKAKLVKTYEPEGK